MEMTKDKEGPLTQDGLQDELKKLRQAMKRTVDEKLEGEGERLQDTLSSEMQRLKDEVVTTIKQGLIDAAAAAARSTQKPANANGVNGV